MTLEISIVESESEFDESSDSDMESEDDFFMDIFINQIKLYTASMLSNPEMSKENTQRCYSHLKYLCELIEENI